MDDTAPTGEDYRLLIKNSISSLEHWKHAMWMMGHSEDELDMQSAESTLFALRDVLRRADYIASARRHKKEYLENLYKV